MDNPNKSWWLCLVINDGNSTRCVNKIVKATNKSFNDESDSILCDPTMPVDILVESQWKYIHVTFKTITVVFDSEPVQAKSAFDVHAKTVFLPATCQVNHACDILVNNII